MKEHRCKIAIIFLAAALLLSGCGNITDNPPAYKPGPTRKVIIDTDAGGDDASAIIMAACSDNLDILGITTLAGNVDLKQSTKNALSALDAAGYDAPVYAGSTENLKGKEIDASSVFGKDGMGDANLVHPDDYPEEMHAVSFILDTVKKNPGEVEIIALGPATNIAKAIQKDPLIPSKTAIPLP